MWIKELFIKNFGKFSNKKIELSSGINLIYGENESGKSTMHTFIRSCLYGMRKMRGRAAKKDDFSRYQPWENGNYYAGSLRFVCGNKIFRLERDFMKGTEGGKLVCETDGELLSLENGDLNMLLGDVGETAFLNTVCIGQLKNETDEGLVSELQNFIANFQESGDRNINMEKAMQLLRSEKKELEKQESKEKTRQEEKLQKISAHMQYLKEEADVCETEIETIKKKREHVTQLLKELPKKQVIEEEPDEGDDEEDVQPSGKSPVFILLVEMVILFLLTLIGYVSRDVSFMKWIIMIVGLVSMGVTALGLKLNNAYEEDEEEGENDVEDDDLEEDEEEEDSAEDSFERVEARREELRRRWNKLDGQLEMMQNRLEEKQTQLENCRQESLSYIEAGTGENYRLRKEKREALDLAMKQMQQVMRQMQGSIGGYLKKRTSEIFREITEGAYTQVQMEENLCIGVHTRDQYIPLEQLSRGTIWQVYFAYRMAAGEILGQEEPLPILLDDAFVMYDDVRLAQVLGWLERLDRQVLIFTCQNREKELMEQLEIAYYQVVLD